MMMIQDFWKRLATEPKSTEIQFKTQPVIKEFVKTHGNMSEYINQLIIADYERQQQQAETPKEN